MHVKLTSSTISSYNACTALLVTCAPLGAKHFSTVTVKNFQKSIQAVWSPNHTSIVFRSGLTLRWVNRWAIISTTSYRYIRRIHKIKYLKTNQAMQALLTVHTVYVCMYVTGFEKTLHVCTKAEIYLIKNNHSIQAPSRHGDSIDIVRFAFILLQMTFCKPCQVIKDQNRPCGSTEGYY